MKKLEKIISLAAPNQPIIKAGTYPVFVHKPMRWIWVPNANDIAPIAQYQQDEWERIIF